MDKDEAKLILGCYRPNGKDALDPEMRNALEMAELDPELTVWFKREQELDSVICEKINDCKAPESLKTSIIVGRKLVGQNIRWKQPQLLAMAAAVAVCIGIVATLSPFEKSQETAVADQNGFDKFRADMVSLVENRFELDFSSGNTEELDMWLMEQGGPLVTDDSVQHLADNAMGCKALKWGGKPVSLLCYSVGQGRMVHLFVMDMNNEPVSNIPREKTKLLETVDKLDTASWQENGKAYLLVAHEPDMKVAQFL